jgi:hypothetical protein
MFIGHYAAGFAAKRVAPRLSLGWAILAAQLVDLLWPIFLLLDIEHVRIAPGDTAFTPLDFYDYPWTHSLVTGIGWGLVLTVVVYLATKYPRGALVAGVLVVSHWLLDAVAHRPDLPLVPGGETRVGLGLWNSVPSTVLVELLLFGIGVALYLRATRAVDRIGRWALVGLIVFLLVVNVANITSPPPPSVETIAWAGLLLWLLPLWGWWIDRHRAAVEASA